MEPAESSTPGIQIQAREAAEVTQTYLWERRRQAGMVQMVQTPPPPPQSIRGQDASETLFPLSPDFLPSPPTVLPVIRGRVLILQPPLEIILGELLLIQCYITNSPKISVAYYESHLFLTHRSAVGLGGSVPV